MVKDCLLKVIAQSKEPNLDLAEQLVGPFELDPDPYILTLLIEIAGKTNTPSSQSIMAIFNKAQPLTLNLFIYHAAFNALAQCHDLEVDKEAYGLLERARQTAFIKLPNLQNRCLDLHQLNFGMTYFFLKKSFNELLERGEILDFILVPGKGLHSNHAYYAAGQHPLKQAMNRLKAEFKGRLQFRSDPNNAGRMMVYSISHKKQNKQNTESIKNKHCDNPYVILLKETQKEALSSSRVPSKVTHTPSLAVNDLSSKKMSKRKKQSCLTNRFNQFKRQVKACLEENYYLKSSEHSQVNSDLENFFNQAIHESDFKYVNRAEIFSLAQRIAENCFEMKSNCLSLFGLQKQRLFFDKVLAASYINDFLSSKISNPSEKF